MLPKYENKQKIVLLNLNTWSSDSSGTFDYSNPSVKQQKAYQENSSYVIRTKYNSFKIINQHADIETGNSEELIFYINNSNENTFFLINFIPKDLKHSIANFNLINNKIWYVINRESPEKDIIHPNYNENYYLNVNDIIKLGKVKFIVQNIHLMKKDYNYNEEEPPMPVQEIQYNISNLNKNSKPVFNNVYIVENYFYNNNLNENNSDESSNDGQNNHCRFCNDSHTNNQTNEDNNFLITICKCGDLIHFKCLKNKFKELLVKDEAKGNYIDSYVFRNFNCPKCKDIYPTKFKLEGHDRIFYLIDILLPNDCNYIILESIDFFMYNEYYKCIYVAKFIKNDIQIGRENDNDIINKDSSMSRHHAKLNFDKNSGKICIQNLNNTYGTLVLVKKPIKLLDKKICLQIGRTYVEASLINREEFDKIQKEN